MDLTTNELQDRRRALDTLARYLARRDHSRKELKEKLSRRFDAKIIEAVLADAETYGWLAKEELIAERLVAALERKNKSRAYILAQLHRKGLPVPEMVEDNELSKARSLLAKKFGCLAEWPRDKQLKAFRYLKHRGFSAQTIKQVFREEPDDQIAEP